MHNMCINVSYNIRYVYSFDIRNFESRKYDFVMREMPIRKNVSSISMEQNGIVCQFKIFYYSNIINKA